MAALTDYMENWVINHMFRNQAFTPPATVYVGLYTSATSDAAAGTEVSGGGYARQAAGLGAASGGAASNAADITFPTATATWGTIAYVALLDALTGGTMMMHGAVASMKYVDNGDSYKINAGELDITMA